MSYVRIRLRKYSYSDCDLIPTVIKHRRVLGNNNLFTYRLGPIKFVVKLTMLKLERLSYCLIIPHNPSSDAKVDTGVGLATNFDGLGLGLGLEGCGLDLDK